MNMGRGFVDAPLARVGSVGSVVLFFFWLQIFSVLGVYGFFFEGGG